jgi:hypothetical protein
MEEGEWKGEERDGSIEMQSSNSDRQRAEKCVMRSEDSQCFDGN